MNNDLISREALKKELEEMANDEWNKQVGSSKGLEDAIDVIDNAPTVETKTVEVVIIDDFGNELKGFYDKGRDMIFTNYGIAPRRWFETKYKITEAKE